jgi:hypothetical protein
MNLPEPVILMRFLALEWDFAFIKREIEDNLFFRIEEHSEGVAGLWDIGASSVL